MLLEVRHSLARDRRVRVLFGKLRRAAAEEDTIVLTAAAADRTSFGCSDETTSPISARRSIGMRCRRRRACARRSTPPSRDPEARDRKE